MKQSPSRISKILRTRLAIGLISMISLVSACNQKPQTEKPAEEIKNTAAVKAKFTRDMVDNKKDPSCGMPLTAGIEDTVHYEGKVYGFCSDECKQQFLKNPMALAKNAEMK
jgi:YHS domain-containing protein